MTWLAFPLISALAAAVSNHIDKFLLDKYFKNKTIGAMLIFSSLMSLPLMTFIYFIHPAIFDISTTNALFIGLNGVIYVLWIIPYLLALRYDDTSTVTPLFQLSSVFSYILGFIILNESLTFNQIFGCLYILLGSVFLSVESKIDHKKGKTKGYLRFFNTRVFLLMSLASVLIALNSIIFKLIALSETFWVTSFWEYSGIFAMGVFFLIFFKKFRSEFLSLFKKKSTSIVSINMSNELINFSSKSLVNYATLLAPVALTSFIAEGFQPFFVLILAVFLAKKLPDIEKEDITANNIIRKFLSICIMAVGTIIISL